MARLTTIAFDADDTLWQNEQFYRLTEQRFAALLADYADPDQLGQRLLEANKRNIGHYGFGIKGYTLSMIETALEVTNHQAPGTVIAEILAVGREMLTHPVETLPYVDQTLAALQPNYRLILITKGDLFDQERKLAASGLAEYFSAVEIVSDKTEAVYRRVFSQLADSAEQTLMIGNSLKSDILPALAAGAFGVYVPHDLTWAYEFAEEPANDPRYARITHLGELSAAIAAFETH